jgi:hypothetical protein
MHFGESLAHLAADIATGHGARKVSAGARTAGLSALHAATRQTLANNTAHRMAVASDLAAEAAALRRGLAAADMALDAEVRDTLAAARLDLAEKRGVINANAKALRARLDGSRRDSVAAVTAFRAATRSEQAARAAALADSLGRFVARVRSETAHIQRAVQDQLTMARAAWGGSDAKAYPQQSSGDVAAPPHHEPVSQTEQIQADVPESCLSARSVWGSADVTAHPHHDLVG